MRRSLSNGSADETGSDLSDRGFVVLLPPMMLSPPFSSIIFDQV